MRLPRALLLSALLAALVPLLANPAAGVRTVATPPWPHEFQGRPLTPLELSADERRLLADFPGAVARFTDGERELVMRWVTRATRQLHPAEDCYRAWGYTTTPARIRADRDGVRWRCFDARKGELGSTREICEEIRDPEGGHWTDVSAWYWAATLRRTAGPWLATTVASPGR
jgi:hypothetical protein